MGLVGTSYKLELCGISVSVIRMELSKAVGRIEPRA